MIPALSSLAFLADAAAALWRFRRILVRYKHIHNTAKTLFEISEATDLSLRDHKAVPGEEIYLYWLIYEALQPFRDYMSTLRTPAEFNDFLLAAIFEAENNRPSNEAQTVVSYLAYQVGQRLAIVEPQLKAPIGEALSNVRVVDSRDPVIVNIIQNQGHFFASAHELEQAYSLPNDFGTYLYTNRENAIVQDFFSLIKDRPTLGTRVQASSSVLGIILNGISSISPDFAITLPATSGPDGLSLSLVSLIAQPTLVLPRSSLPVERTINPLMVSSYAISDMEKRGFVQLENREYVRREDATATEEGYVRKVPNVDETHAPVKDLLTPLKNRATKAASKMLGRAMKRIIS